MWKRKRKIEEKKEDLLKELCGDDEKLYDLLGSRLYRDPIAAISKEGLRTLFEEAVKSDKDENYEEARQKYLQVIDKAIFEATQNPRERSRYIEVIQDLVSKTVTVTEKVKEKVEKKGLVEYASSLERSSKKFEFMSKRIEDVIRAASLYYNERLEELGVKERRDARRKARIVVESEERMEDRRAAERQEARREERKKMGRASRKEAEREDKRIEVREEEKRKERKEKRIEAEREDKRIEVREEEKRKERKEKRRKELDYTR